MTKFYGVIGYGEGKQVETSPGVWEVVPIEYSYRGDVIRPGRKLESGDQVNNDISVTNSISIVADAYAREHFMSMSYVMWLGVRWKIDTVSVEPPRLILKLGGVYNGHTPTAPDTP